MNTLEKSIKNQVCHQVRNRVWDCVWIQVEKMIDDRVGNCAHNRVVDRVYYQVRDQLDQIKDKF